MLLKNVKLITVVFSLIIPSIALAAGVFPQNIPVSTLNGINGFTIWGTQKAQFEPDPIQISGHFGSSVSDAGDLNGDGRADFVIGAPWMYDFGNLREAAGQIFAFFGQNQFPPFFYSSDLLNQNPVKGITLHGEQTGHLAGDSVNNLGDINGDGVDDIIIGIYDDRQYNRWAGKAYVIFGTKIGFPFFGSSLTNTPNFGFIITGDEGDDLGQAVSGAGDVNGDGISDILIGAPHHYHPIPPPLAPLPLKEGRCYVIYGSKKPFPFVFNVKSLDGTNGFAIHASTISDKQIRAPFGSFVSSAGDFNLDGIDDLLIGAPSESSFSGANSGRAYLIYGKQGGLQHPFSVNMLNGTNGVVINGISDQQYLGTSVSDLGDINGDGRDDIIIGARRIYSVDKPIHSNSDTYQPSAYIIYGRSTPFQTETFSPGLKYLNGFDGFVIHGEDSNQDVYLLKSISVSGAGDVNGDGKKDIIVGVAMNQNLYAGKSYVVFGRPKNGFPHFYVTSLNGMNGFSVSPKNNFGLLGYSVSGAGDVNGDGVDDIIIGAPLSDPHSWTPIAATTQVGESYVIFGKKGDFEPEDDNPWPW